MTPRGSIPSSLPYAGVLALAGLGLLLLPFVPGLAQQPSTGGDTKDLVDKLHKQLSVLQKELAQTERDKAVYQQDLAAMQQALERQRAQLERQVKALQDAIERLKAKQHELTPGPMAGGKGAPMAEATPTPKAAPGQYKSSTAPGTKAAGVEQRLEQIEHKLDTLLWEITNLRHEAHKLPPTPSMVPPAKAIRSGKGSGSALTPSNVPPGTAAVPQEPPAPIVPAEPTPPSAPIAPQAVPPSPAAPPVPPSPPPATNAGPRTS
jgi:hypothetical protein